LPATRIPVPIPQRGEKDEKRTFDDDTDRLNYSRACPAQAGARLVSHLCQQCKSLPIINKEYKTKQTLEEAQFRICIYYASDAESEFLFLKCIR